VSRVVDDDRGGNAQGLRGEQQVHRSDRLTEGFEIMASNPVARPEVVRGLRGRTRQTILRLVANQPQGASPGSDSPKPGLAPCG
jgi:hypothetical protein